MLALSCLKWFPVIVIQAVGFAILYGYIAVIRHWRYTTLGMGFAQAVPFILTLLYEICFIWTVASRVPPISEKYGRFSEEYITSSTLNNFFVYTRTENNRPRFCRECGILQPDRAYHCPTCEVCVPRMDHHCFWMNNCIHFRNLKYFIQTLWYGAAACFAMAAICIAKMIKAEILMTVPKEIFDFYTIVLALMLIALLLVCLGAYCVWLVLVNQTHMERAHGIFVEGGVRNDRLFDLGWQRNFHQIFGDCIFLICCPTFTAHGNGEVFQLSGKGVDSIEMVEVGEQV